MAFLPNSPPPIASDDEDEDDFGDFETVFDKPRAGSVAIKDRIDLDISADTQAKNRISPLALDTGELTAEISDPSPGPIPSFSPDFSKPFPDFTPQFTKEVNFEPFPVEDEPNNESPFHEKEISGELIESDKNFQPFATNFDESHEEVSSKHTEEGITSMRSSSVNMASGASGATDDNVVVPSSGPSSSHVNSSDDFFADFSAFSNVTSYNIDTADSSGKAAIPDKSDDATDSSSASEIVGAVRDNLENTVLQGEPKDLSEHQQPSMSPSDVQNSSSEVVIEFATDVASPAEQTHPDMTSVFSWDSFEEVPAPDQVSGESADITPTSNIESSNPDVLMNTKFDESFPSVGDVEGEMTNNLVLNDDVVVENNFSETVLETANTATFIDFESTEVSDDADHCSMVSPQKSFALFSDDEEDISSTSEENVSFSNRMDSVDDISPITNDTIDKSQVAIENDGEQEHPKDDIECDDINTPPANTFSGSIETSVLDKSQLFDEEAFIGDRGEDMNTTETFAAFSVDQHDSQDEFATFGDFGEAEASFDPCFDNFSATKNTLSINANDRLSPISNSETQKEADSIDVTGTMSDVENLDKSSDCKSSDFDDFDDFADFESTNVDANDGFEDFVKPRDCEFADFGSQDQMNDNDDDFDDFAEFGTINEQPSKDSTNIIMPLEKVLHSCYQDESLESTDDITSVYTNGVHLMQTVASIDHQFAVSSKWISSPSYTRMVNTLCLSSGGDSGRPNTNPRSTQQANTTQGETSDGDAFDVFGKVDSSTNSQPLALLPEDLACVAETKATKPAMHADILSAYSTSTSEKQQLSDEALAIVNSLPDLTFMLSPVLMFPVKG